MSENSLLLPPGAVLLHIGTPKTGTTALQSSVRTAIRKGLITNVVRAVKGGSDHAFAKEILRNQDGPAIAGMHKALIEKSDSRLFVTSELIARADIEQAKRLREILGANTHVLITLRAFTGFLPSMWQQQVKRQSPLTQDEWLRQALKNPGSCEIEGDRVFHQTDGSNLIDRWASVFGAENVTVVIVDKTEPERGTRVFEEMMGLTRGVLPILDQNRGLTASEVQLISTLNQRLTAENRRVKYAVYRDLMLVSIRGMQYNRKPDPSEPRVELPEWAIAPVTDFANHYIEIIKKSGVRVVGEVGELASPPKLSGKKPEAVDPIAMDLIYRLVTRAAEIDKAHVEALRIERFNNAPLWKKVARKIKKLVR